MNLSTNQEILMSQKQISKNQWCSFQATQKSSIVIQLIALCGQIIFAFVLVIAYMRAKKQHQLQRINFIYKIIVIWLICFFLKTLNNIIAYFVYIEHSPLNAQNATNNGIGSEINFTGLRIMSAFFLLLDSTTTFFIQMAMIYIPFLWMKNGIVLIDQDELSVQERIKIGRISQFLIIVKKYLLIRNIYAFYFIAVAIVVVSCDSVWNSKMYIVIVSMIESFVILAIYPFGLWTLNIIKRNIALNDKQTRSMFLQYIALLSSNLVRIILNSVFHFSNLVDYEADEYCYNRHKIVDSNIECLYLAFGLSLMHFLPAGIILYLYWPSTNSQSQLQKSILGSQYRLL